MIPEANCIWIIYETLKTFDLPDFVIKINHKSLLNAILAISGVPADKIKNVCYILAEYDKVDFF